MSRLPYRLSACALALLCLAAGPAAGAGSGSTPGPGAPAPLSEYRPESPARDSSLGWDSLRMLLGLGGVVGLLVGGGALLRRWSAAGGLAGAAGAAQIVGRLPLTAKEAVCLIRVGGEILVVGVSAAGVTLLHRLAAEALEGGTGAGARAWRAETPGSPASGRRDQLWSRIREVQSLWGLGASDEGRRQR